ncbi:MULTISPECIES: hypothetical protein [Arthrobacter]|uniref:Uncharacterized protein n=1 Tax=Arthrobacter terricola TaxID=2547396 RepID=A0A4R5KM74_9MICC|nr:MULTISPECIES: hypothetical protein [Arthrobacter]MBT8161449.1 hypothetical protein [Arthrobacter sp. GN70]TDF95620.1 hypothetical protein E1809_11375 [Arthrobacter terricola]
MEANKNLYRPTEPVAATVRAKFVELIAVLPEPTEMTDEQLTECAELVAQFSMDIGAAYNVLDSEIAKRGLGS